MTWHSVGTSLVTSTITTVALISALLKVATPRVLDRLLGHYLDARSAGERARRERELEALRTDLSHLQDRGRRSNEQEYQAIIASWEAFLDAYYEVTTAIVGMSTRPRLDGLNEEELRERLEASSFTALEIRYVANARDRLVAFEDVERTRRLNRAIGATWSASLTVRKGSVFMLPDLFSQFEAGLYELRRVNAEGLRGAGGAASEALTADGERSIIEVLRAAVRTRLLHVGGEAGASPID